MASGGRLGDQSFGPVNRLVLVGRRLLRVVLVISIIEVHSENGDQVREKRFNGPEQPSEQPSERQSERRPTRAPGSVFADRIAFVVSGHRQPLPDPRVPEPGLVMLVFICIDLGASLLWGGPPWLRGFWVGEPTRPPCRGVLVLARRLIGRLLANVFPYPAGIERLTLALKLGDPPEFRPASIVCRSGRPPGPMVA